MTKWIIKLVLLFTFMALPSKVFSQTLQKITIKGNLKVEGDAINAILESKKGTKISNQAIANDIVAIFDLGFFSDVRVYKVEKGDAVELVFEVVEKASIVSIVFEGLEEVTEEDLEGKLSTKLYTILDESKISDDLRLIEKSYAEKGFFLTKATYEITNLNKNESMLTFRVQENGKVLVGNVFIHGNEYFTDSQLSEFMATRPTTRSSSLGSSSLYQEAFVARDVEFLGYYYRDSGFAEVKMGNAITEIGLDRNYVDVTFSLEEGTQYWLGDVEFSGDLLYSKEELFETLELKSGDLFRISRFRKDIDALIDKYGDLGYAYVDVNPKTKFDRKNNKVHIDFSITKGPKVYFGLMEVVGNTKTRDNVIRRELEIADGDLYSRVGLRESKRGVEQLGFFETVQILKERDSADENKLNLKIKIKEKPTGQLQAAIGYNPGGSSDASWFGQGSYKEANQSGKGWKTQLTAKTDGGDNYQFDLGFSDPRVNDSIWSLGLNLGYEQQENNSLGFEILEKRKSASVAVGRKIIEKIRGTIALSYKNVTQETEEFLRELFRLEGDIIGLSFSVGRSDLDNSLDPTEGTSISGTHKFVGGVLGGGYKYMESLFNAAYYVPLSYTDTYKTHFKFTLKLGKLYPYEGEPVPLLERYKLGGANDLRGFPSGSITPRFAYLATPFSDVAPSTSIRKGGDRQLLFQAEYFMPLIPQAGIKALVFYDAGRVYDNEEEFDLSDLSQDIGFGIRWITPIAPFRFEWAFPYEEGGDLGKGKLVFSIGY